MASYSTSFRRVFARAVLALSVALLAAPRLAKSSPITLELERDLGRIERDLSDLCAPNCGQVSIGQPAAEANASSRRIDAHTSELSFNHELLADWRRSYGASAAFFVVAHEYGHHLVRVDDKWSGELAADAVGGCALARENLDLLPSVTFMRHEHFVELVHAVYDDPNAPETIARRVSSHPPWLNRLAALRSGAELCRQGAQTTASLLAGIAQFPSVRAQRSETVVAVQRAPWRWGDGKFSWHVPACFSVSAHCREYEPGLL